MPMLVEVKLFGHSQMDEADKLKVDRLFASEDTDGSRMLDEQEVHLLTTDLGLHLTQNQFQEVRAVCE